MAAKDLELALKKQRLQLEAATQRIALGQTLQALSPALTAADTIRSGWQWARAHPQWLAGAAGALLVVRPRAFFRWTRRGLFLWRGVRTLQRAAQSRLSTH